MSVYEDSPFRTKDEQLLAPNPLARPAQGFGIIGGIPGGAPGAGTPTPTPGGGALVTNTGGAPNAMQKDATAGNTLARPPGPLDAPPPAGGVPVVTPPAAQQQQQNIRPQDTIQMFSRLNPQVQTQVLISMGLTPEQAQTMVTSIGQHHELQADNPNIVNVWNQLFSNSGVDVGRLGSTIFSDSVHPADADHNYQNYGAIGFDPGHGLVATPESGQVGEVNRRGLRQAERPLEMAALGALAYFLGPEILSALGPEAGGGAFAGGTAAVEGGADAFAGGLAGAEGGGAAAIADGLTPGIGDMIDTSLLPNVTSPTLPGLEPTPNFGAPGALGGADAGGHALEVTSPGAGGAVDSGGHAMDVVTGNEGGSFADTLLSPNNLLRGAGTIATVAGLSGRHGTSPGQQTAQNVVNQNQPLGDDARNVLTNHGAPTQDQRSAIDSSIEQQRQQGTEAIIQASINAGQGGKDSMVVQDKIRAFGQQLETMRQQLYMKQAEQNTLMALRELGMVNDQQFMLAQMQLQQDTQAQQRAASIMQSLGWLWTLGG